MKIFKKKEEKKKIGRPKLADTKLKKTSLIICIVCFAISFVLLSIGAYELNIIPNTNKLKGSVNVDLCSEIPARFRPYDAETNPEGLHEYGFTDPKFYSAVLSTGSITNSYPYNYAYNSSNYCNTITEGELNGITRLDISSNIIDNAEGLQYLNNLSYLNLSGSSYSSTNGGNGNLTSIDVSQNTALTHLSLSFNKLSSIDVSQNTALTYLNLNSNKLSSIDVSRNTALTWLDLFRNNISSIDVSQNTALTDLSLSFNKLSSIDVSQNTALTYLNLNSNKLSSIDLSKNTSLTSLHLSITNLNSIDNIKGIESLKSKLSDFGVENSNLTSIDLSEFTSLTTLYLDGNNLSSIDLSQNTVLKYLHLSNNNLSSIDVSKNTALRSLKLDDNNISSIDLSHNTSLTYLNLHSNKLSSIDLSQNTALTNLYLHNNNLSSIDLSQNTALTYMILSGNNFNKTYTTFEDNITIEEPDVKTAYPDETIYKITDTSIATYENGIVKRVNIGSTTLKTTYKVSSSTTFDVNYTINFGGITSNYYTINYENKTIDVKGEVLSNILNNITLAPYNFKKVINGDKLEIKDNNGKKIDEYEITNYVLYKLTSTNYTINYENKTIDTNGYSFYESWLSLNTSNYTKTQVGNIIQIKDNNGNLVDTYTILYKITSTNYIIDNESKTIDVKGEVLSNVNIWNFSITPLNFQKVINGNKLEIKDNNGNLLDIYKIINYSDYKLYSNVYEIDKENKIIDLKDNIYIKNNIWINPYNYSFDTNKDIIEIKDNNGNLIDTYKLINARKEDENAYTKAGFKDKNLYTCVVRSYYDDENISGNYLLTDEELEEVNYLYCYNVEIKDTTGLEKLTNLSELHLYNNNLSNIKLPDNDLYALVLANNNISGTLDLSKYENLEFLYLENNKLDNIILPNNPNFSGALLHNNNLKSVDLSSYPNLSVLTLQDNPLSTIYMLKNTTMKYSDILKLNSSIEVEYKISDKSIVTYNNDVIKALEEGITTLKLYNENIIGFDSKLFDKSLECEFNYTKECDEIDWDKMELEYFMSNEIKVYDIKSDVYKIDKDKKTIDVKGTDLDLSKVKLTLNGLKGIIEGNYYVIKDGAREVDKYKILNPKVVVKEEITTTTKQIGSTTTSKKATNTITKENNDIKLSTSIVPSILLQSIKGQDRNIIVTKDGITFTINGKDIEKVNGNLDLSVEIEDIEKTILKEELKEKVEKAVILNFKNKIELPGKILVEINKTEEIENSIGIKNINVYNYDKDKYNLIAQDLSFNDNKIKFYVDKLGYYVLTNEKVEGKKLVLDSTMLGENNKLNKEIKGNKVIILIVIFVILITLGIVGYVCYRKKNQ